MPRRTDHIIDPPQPRPHIERDPDPREPPDEYPDDDLDGPPDSYWTDDDSKTEYSTLHRWGLYGVQCVHVVSHEVEEDR